MFHTPDAYVKLTAQTVQCQMLVNHQHQWSFLACPIGWGIHPDDNYARILQSLQVAQVFIRTRPKSFRWDCQGPWRTGRVINIADDVLLFGKADTYGTAELDHDHRLVSLIVCLNQKNISQQWWWYHSLTAHQHQKGHTVQKQVIMIASSIQVATVQDLHCVRAFAIRPSLNKMSDKTWYSGCATGTKWSSKGNQSNRYIGTAADPEKISTITNMLRPNDWPADFHGNAKLPIPILPQLKQNHSPTDHAHTGQSGILLFWGTRETILSRKGTDVQDLFIHVLWPRKTCSTPSRC